MKRRGFTLLEVLLALGLVALLAAGVMGFLWTLLGQRDRVGQHLMDSQAGAALLERLESDILCGLAGDDRSGAGIKGTSTGLRILTRGVALPVEAEGQGLGGDLQGSEYTFGGGAIRARRWMSGVSPGGEFEVVSNQVEALRLSYFDGESWRSSFDSAAADGLPVAIEVALWFGTPSAEPAIAPTRLLEMEEVASEAPAGPTRPVREPDRLRVIVVPDGPVSAWKEAR